VTELRRTALARSAQGTVLRGCLLMCCATALFPFLNACAKLLTAGYPVGQILWARFAGHLVFVLIAFLPLHGIRLFVTHRPKVQIARSVLLLGATMCFISGISGVPLATASAILFATPIIVAALSGPLLGERVSLSRWIAVLVGFAGVLVIIRPGGTSLGLPAVFIIGSALCYSFYQIVTRRGGSADSAETGIVYAALVGTAATSLAVPFFFRMPASLFDGALFAGLGFFGGFGHYLLTRAFQLAPATVLSPLGYTELLSATILGYLVFGTVPDEYTWLGAVIIVASGVYIASQGRAR
jgi:drug/metabolite transporter (DMT)-like permease